MGGRSGVCIYRNGAAGGGRRRDGRADGTGRKGAGAGAGAGTANFIKFQQISQNFWQISQNFRKFQLISTKFH